MDLILIALCFAAVIVYYFRHNPMHHGRAFVFRRFVNWFPLGMSYAFLYMARYNLVVAKNALGDSLSLVDFGWIFGAGTVVYGLSFLINGPLTDKIGGKRGIIISVLGAALANAGMGVVVYLFMQGRLTRNLSLLLGLLYCLNMYFQSYGAVSIIKVKAYWFHVRERGVFGAIFGTLISFGVYFAYDWGQAIVDAAKAHVDGTPTLMQRLFEALFSVGRYDMDSIWLVFFIPSAILVAWGLIDVALIKDMPSQAGYEDFDTHDASSGEMDRNFSHWELLQRVFTSRFMMIFAAIEFTAGVIRNGVMQWYKEYAHQLPAGSVDFFMDHWGFLLCFAGIIGGFSGGIVSDRFFQSRRGPPAGIAQGLIFAAAAVMAVVIFASPTVVSLCALVMACAVIAVHSLMSGTAAADFGGRKATATASGIVDGFVYLGSGLQSVCLGYLNTISWHFWPLFMAPFALIGFFLALKIWRDLPAATKRYLLQVERITVLSEQDGVTVVAEHREESLEIIGPN
jgi:OPA family glycerol-3-phosphate transporter-like MFS transporter